jgi:hypothetical protein
MSKALSCRPLSFLGYAIYNNLLGAHGWNHVRVLAQKTSDNKMLDKIKRRVGQMEKAHKVRMEPKIQASPEVLVLASRLERPRVLMSCAWTILFVMPCFIFLVWIRNCFLDRNNSGPNRHWHMDGRNINIRSLPTCTITISCYQLHTCLFLVIHCLIVP